MALIGVLLILILVSALCATLAMSGQTETLAASNQESAAQARAAAEAGLNHGLTVAIANLTTNAVSSTASAAIDILLLGPDGVASTADDGSLEALGVPRPPATTQLLPGVTYEVRSFDDDDPARGLSPGLTAAEIGEIEENSQPLTDANERVVLRAIGRGRNNTTVTLEAIVGATTLPAIVTNGNLTISGSVEVSGGNGGVHSNGNLTVTNSATTISQNATASGTATIHPGANIGGDELGGQSTLPVPPIHAINYKPLADYILTSTGQLLDRDGNVLACCRGWTFSGVEWSNNSNGGSTATHGGTYYVEGSARLTGSLGSSSSPVAISIIATGSIEIAGSPDLTPFAPELLFVTDGDLKMSGSLATPKVEGQILVREQIDIKGTPDIAGQLLVENAASVFPDVVANTISGNLKLTYNGIAGSDQFAVGGWREIR
ncbi:MAG: hypothetical protein ACREUZ_03885 [Burkholderiales bacterium]